VMLKHRDAFTFTLYYVSIVLRLSKTANIQVSDMEYVVRPRDRSYTLLDFTLATPFQMHVSVLRFINIDFSLVKRCCSTS